MADLENVTQGLSIHSDIGEGCYGCPYFSEGDPWKECLHILCADAIELLKEQDRLLHKKQKDIDKLCADISDLRHRFHEKTEIVRCKDCEYSYTEGFVHERLKCEKHPEFFDISDDWFCADCWKA